MSVDRLFDFILKSSDRTFQVEFEKLVEHSSNEKVKSIVKTVLNDVPISTIMDIDGMALLHLAAKYGNVELMKFFIGLGSDVNIKTLVEETPLLTAYKFNHFDAMEVLLNADANFSIEEAENILRDLIVEKDNYEIMQNINNNSLDTLITALIQRLKKSNDNLKTLSALLAKLDCPLKYIINVGDPLFTQTIIRNRKYEVIYEYDETELVIKHLMKTGDIEHLRVLWRSRCLSDYRRRFLEKLNQDITWLSRDRDPDNLDWKFIVPAFKQLDKWIVYDKCFVEFLWMLFLNADEVALEVLLQECNVDVQMKEKYRFDVLPLLYGNRKNRDRNIGELALKRNFDVNAKSFEGRTALHNAVFYNHPRDNVRHLLDLGADCSIKDDNGFSSLSMSYDPECCQLLLQSGQHLPLGQNHESEVVRIIQISGFYDIWKPVVAQLAFERYQGLEIKELIVKTIRAIPKIKIYYEECLRQVEELMGREILPSLTMFDIMTGKAEKLAEHIKSEETIRTITEWCSQQNLNSFYASSLEEKSKKAFNIFRSKCRAASIIHKNTSVLINYNDLVVEKICGYLFYRDIQNLASA